ncbi:hypothetical protein HPB47_016218, partial [Ixodes persulcatus]
NLTQTTLTLKGPSTSSRKARGPALANRDGGSLASAALAPSSRSGGALKSHKNTSGWPLNDTLLRRPVTSSSIVEYDMWQNTLFVTQSVYNPPAFYENGLQSMNYGGLGALIALQVVKALNRKRYGEFHWSFWSALESVDQIRNGAHDPNGVTPPTDAQWNMTTAPGSADAFPSFNCPGIPFPRPPRQRGEKSSIPVSSCRCSIPAMRRCLGSQEYGHNL